MTAPLQTVANKPPFDAGRAAYLALNFALLFFLLAPIAIVLVFALNPTPYISFPPVGVNLRWFQKFFANPEFINALLLSLWVAGCVLVLSIVIGGACALALARGNLPGRTFLTAFFMSPLMVPAILTGLALLRAVRGHPAARKVPFILLTGRGDRELVVQAAQAGANNYLIKPFTADILRQKIEQAGGSVVVVGE